jgi:hypothetical protein
VILEVWGKLNNCGALVSDDPEIQIGRFTIPGLMRWEYPCGANGEIRPSPGSTLCMAKDLVFKSCLIVENEYSLPARGEICKKQRPYSE